MEGSHVVKLHAQYKQGRLPDCSDPSTALLDKADLTSNTLATRPVSETHALQAWHQP